MDLKDIRNAAFLRGLEHFHYHNSLVIKVKM